MSRRIEGPISRDWSFGFVTWSDVFRSYVNLRRSLYAYERKDETHIGANFTFQTLEKGAIEIAQALWGTYKDNQGHNKNVRRKYNQRALRSWFVSCSSSFITNIY